jgi:hypothetical protein
MADDNPTGPTSEAQVQPAAPTPGEPAPAPPEPEQQADPGPHGPEPFVHPAFGNLAIRSTDPTVPIRTTDGHIEK